MTFSCVLTGLVLFMSPTVELGRSLDELMYPLRVLLVENHCSRELFVCTGQASTLQVPPLHAVHELLM